MNLNYFTAILAMTLPAAMASAQSPRTLSALPPIVVDHPQAEELIELGRQLYFDPRLSGDSSTSCAECHDPQRGFGDAAELSRGYPGTKHWRNSQTIINSAYLTGGLHWDATVPSLLHQVPGAMGASIVANIDATMAEERLRQIPAYVESFDRIWKKEPSMDEIAEAIAAYERTLISTDSPFDQFARGTAPLSDTAGRGYLVFIGKGNCIACHNGMLATDESFHNTSVPPNPAFTEDPLLQVTFRVMMRDFDIPEKLYSTFDRDPGRFIATKNPNHLGELRTAPLRYLKYTAPYMHNGVFYTLDEVVDFYNEGGTPDVFGTKSPLIKPLGLSDSEKTDLVAFLESLSGSEVLTDFPDLPKYEAQAFPKNPISSGGERNAQIKEYQAKPEENAPIKTGASGLESKSNGLMIMPSDG
ncbi:MAG: cytochrome c peroxidase [Paracoccaceae bacterium]